MSNVTTDSVDSTEVVERFYRALLDEIRAQQPVYLAEPFTVAEIYQNLVPYSTHRDRIGVEMNGDYEFALMRLLAGEGDFLVLESEPALRDLRAELDTANPNTGLYREYAAVDVRLNPSRVDVGEASTPEPMGTSGPSAVGEPVSMADLAPAAGQAAPPKNGGSPEITLVPEPEEPTPVAEMRDDADACQWCRAELPVRSNLNFCPFCGTDLNVVPCSSCGEELEPGWRFCVACGAEVAEGGD